MSFDNINNLDLIKIGAVFGLVASLWILFALIWSIRRAMRVQKVERRLGLNDTEEASTSSHIVRLWHEGRETTTTVPEFKAHNRLWKALERYFRDAGWKTPPEVLLIGVVGVSVLVFTFVLLITGTTIGAIGAAVTVIILFFLYTRHQHDRSILSFERQFADALGMVARSLRAGYPLLSGFKHATEELPRPVRDIFSEICQQQEMGVTIQEALRRASFKYNTRDVRLFTAAAIIQIESGGNLADLMDRLSCVIRERMRIGRRIRVLTSQTKFSARTLAVLPFLAFFGINIVNKDYMAPLYLTNTGRLMLAGGIMSLLVGIWVMNRLSALRY